MMQDWPTNWEQQLLAAGQYPDLTWSWAVRMCHGLAAAMTAKPTRTRRRPTRAPTTEVTPGADGSRRQGSEHASGDSARVGRRVAQAEEKSSRRPTRGTFWEQTA